MEQLLQLRGLKNQQDVYAVDCEELVTADLESILESAAGRPVIIVYSKLSVTPKKIATYQNLCSLELFERDRLRILLAGHRFIVPHIRLNEEERESIVRRYAEENLPKLLQTDPIARLHGFKIGDVILIRRPQIYFRIVVPA